MPRVPVTNPITEQAPSRLAASPSVAVREPAFLRFEERSERVHAVLKT
jgi:hypothetical protein